MAKDWLMTFEKYVSFINEYMSLIINMIKFKLEICNNDSTNFSKNLRKIIKM